MQKTISLIFRKAGFCLVILTLLALLAACGGSTTTSGSTNPTATATTASNTPAPTGSTLTQTPATTSPNVSIANFSFSPATLTIAKGTKVTWTNNDSVTHTVTSDQGTWDSNGVPPGNTFNFTFAKTGTYTYHCKIHPSMKATIIVQ